MSDALLAIDVAVVARSLFWGWFLGTGLVLAIIDARTHRLPNALVALTFVGALPLLLVSQWGAGPIIIVRSLLASCALVLGYLLLHVLRGVGMGDVKYASVIGLYLGSLGWQELWRGTVAAFAIGAAWIVGRQMRTGRDRHRRHAFGPAMVLGAAGVAAWTAGWGAMGA